MKRFHADSDIDSFIEKAPQNWHIKRLKYVAPIKREKLDKKPEDLTYIGLEHIEPWIGLLYESDVEEVKSSVNVFDKGNILLGKLRPYLAKVIVAPFKGVCTTELVVLDVNEHINTRFIFYQIISHRFITVLNALSYGVKMPRANPYQIETMITLIPPIEEQNSIAMFLDLELSKIDEIIFRYHQFIKFIKEKRFALINHVVNYGLDPDVQLVDSGLNWINIIPEKWKVRKIKYVSERVLTGKTPPSGNPKYYDQDKINWFGPGDLSDNLILTESSKKISRNAILDNKAIKFKKFSVLIVGIGATVGKVGMITEDSCSNQQINAIEFDSNIIRPKYGLYYLYGIKEIVANLANTSTIPIFNQTQTENLNILIPPIEEQEEIITFIDKEMAKMGIMIQKITEQIDLLKEYKISLINKAIIGEIDSMGVFDGKSFKNVRGWDGRTS
jgi:type I restriction enzyme S subunit